MRVSRKKANKNHKDSVFTKLFGNEETLLELYSALEGTHYGKDTKIRITTLDDTLYMERKNDISFVIDGKIVVLIEHQSTINENMPLRMLFYISRLYEKITNEREENLYRKGIITIPKPEFIVLYNGEDEAPDEQTLRLSDMFAKHGKKSTIDLELTVKVLNINKGHNLEIAARSLVLSDYETFIEVIREYKKKTKDLRTAMELAVKECIRRNILKNFLKANASEVMNMLFGEWNWDKALEVREMEGYEKGIEEGIEKGREEGVEQFAKLIEQGVSVAEAKKRLGIKNKSPLKSGKNIIAKKRPAVRSKKSK